MEIHNFNFTPKWATTEEITPRASLLNEALALSASSLDRIRIKIQPHSGVFSGYKIYSDEVYAVIDGKLYPLALRAPSSSKKMKILKTANEMLALANNILQAPVPTPQVPVTPHSPLVAEFDAPPLRAGQFRGRGPSRKGIGRRSRAFTPVKIVSEETDQKIQRLEREIAHLREVNLALLSERRRLEDALAEAKRGLSDKHSLVEQLRHQLLESQEKLAESEAKNEMLKLELASEKEAHAALKRTLSRSQELNLTLLQDLKRLQDIIGTQQNTIKSLNVELQEAQQSNEQLKLELITAKLRERALSAEGEILKKELTEIESVLLSLRTSLKKVSAEKGSLQEELKTANDALSKTRYKIAENERLASIQSSKIEALKGKISVIDRETSTLKDHLEKARSQLAISERENLTLKQEARNIIDLESALESALKENRTIRSTLSDIKRQNAAYIAQIESLHAKNQDTRKSLAVLAAEGGALRRELDERTLRIKSLDVAKLHLEKENELLQSSLALSNQRASEAEDKFAQIASIKREQEDQLSALQQKLQALESIQASYNALQERYNSLESSLSMKTSEVEQLRSQLEIQEGKIASSSDAYLRLQESLKLKTTELEEIKSILSRSLDEKDKLEALLSRNRDEFHQMSTSFASQSAELTSKHQAAESESKATVLKLKQAQAVLSENQNLIRQLNAQIASLDEENKGAHKALEVGAAREAELRSDLERTFLKIQRLEENKSALEEHNQSLRSSLALWEQRAQQAETGIEEIKSKMEAEKAEFKAVSAQFESIIKGQEDQLSILQGKLEPLESRIKELERLKSQLLNETALQAQIELLTAKSSELQNQNEVLDNELRSARSKLQRIPEREQELEKLTSQLDRNSATISENEKLIADLRQELEILRKRNASYEALEKRYQTLEALSLEKASEIDQLKSELHALQDRMGASGLEQSRLEKTLSGKTAELEEIKIILHQLKDEKSELQSLLARKDQEIKSLRTQFEYDLAGLDLEHREALKKITADQEEALLHLESEIVQLKKLRESELSNIEEIKQKAQSVISDLSYLIRLYTSTSTTPETLQTEISKFRASHPEQAIISIFDELATLKREQKDKTVRLKQFEMILNQLKTIRPQGTVTIESLRKLVETYISELGQRDDVRSENIKLREELTKQKEKIRNLSQELSQQKEMLKLELEQEVRLLEQREQKLAEAEKQLRLALRDLATLKKERHELQSVNDDLISSLSYLQISFRDFEINPERAIRAGIQKMRDTIESQREKIFSLEQSKEGFALQIADLETTISKLGEDLESKQDELTTAAELGLQVSEENLRLSAALEEKNLEFEKLKDTQNLAIETLKGQLAESERKQHAQEEALTKTEVRLSETIAAQSALSSDISSLLAELEALRGENILLRHSLVRVSESETHHKAKLGEVTRVMNDALFKPN
jgi:chromosome segregation ATPase